MIYITKTYENNYGEDYTFINNVWSIDDKHVDPKQLYLNFMIEKSKEFDIVINPHWLNPMNYEDHNQHLTKTMYKKICKRWNSYLYKYGIDRYILEELNGTKLEFKEL